MPTVDAGRPASGEASVPGVLAAPQGNGQSGSEEALQRFLDVAVIGNRGASRAVRRIVDAVEKVAPLDRVGPTRQLEVLAAAFEMTQRLIHAPYDISHGLVQSAVLVNVDVDVDIASNQAPQQRIGEEGHNGDS